jgi:broad specificity phosphatase PhoE
VAPDTVVYLARHGSPDLGRTDLVYHLPPGPPLTAAGEREAAELGQFFAARGVRRIWASPLERARRTAEIAATISGADLVVDDRLLEMQPGEAHEDVRRRTWPAWLAATGAAISAPAAVVAHGGVATALLQALGASPETLESLGRRFDSGNPLPPGGAWEIVLDGSGPARTPRLAFVPGQATLREGRPGSVS